MANVSFYSGTADDRTLYENIREGNLYFHTSNKIIYLGTDDMGNMVEFNGNYAAPIPSDPTLSYGQTSAIGKVGEAIFQVTMPQRPDLKYNQIGITTTGTFTDAFDLLHYEILHFLNNPSSSVGSVMYIDFVVESTCYVANYADSDHFSSAGRFVIPYHGLGFRDIDETQSDRGDGVNIVSTPNVIADGTSIQTCVVILQCS